MRPMRSGLGQDGLAEPTPLTLITGRKRNVGDQHMGGGPNRGDRVTGFVGKVAQHVISR